MSGTAVGLGIALIFSEAGRRGEIRCPVDGAEVEAG
jgi:hypothetical protein